jgi:hypothetical protein
MAGGEAGVAAAGHGAMVTDWPGGRTRARPPGRSPFSGGSYCSDGFGCWSPLRDNRHCSGS